MGDASTTALRRAFCKTGSKMEMSTAMIAITTSSSTSVKAARFPGVFLIIASQSTMSPPAPGAIAPVHSFPDLAGAQDCPVAIQDPQAVAIRNLRCGDEKKLCVVGEGNEIAIEGEQGWRHDNRIIEPLDRSLLKGMSIHVHGPGR